MESLLSIIVLYPGFILSFSQINFGDSRNLDGNRVKTWLNLTLPSFCNPDSGSSCEVTKGT